MIILQKQSKKYSIYNNIKTKKATNLHIGEAETRESLTFLLENGLKRLIDSSFQL